VNAITLGAIVVQNRLSDYVGEAIVWDNHACMPLRANDKSYLHLLKASRDTGVNVVTLNVGFGEQGIAEHIAMLASFRHWLAERRDDYLLVRNMEDVLLAKSTNKLGVCFDVEGMNGLGGLPDMVAVYYDLGVRWMSAVYNRGNLAGGGCMDQSDDGLTEFGQRVVQEMNSVGMVVCASHCGYRTARELIDYSATPVVFSHSNPRGVWDNPRNIPDDLMIACASRGGVIGLNGFGLFLGANDASTETFVAHVEYAINLVGEDHVGLALDYIYDRRELEEFFAASPEMFPAEQGYGRGVTMVEPTRLADVAAMLSHKGYSPATLGKVFGGNHLRIAETVWH
jgi:membrane dipeptidase